ncbi:MAG: cbb3-type cytochrome c oxidase subunit I, partial [Gemmatimonadetes bacterium]|nr:cbb3-type cytochrome c oxidase subunit I [Gemmatimonadota bacterium]
MTQRTAIAPIRDEEHPPEPAVHAGVEIGFWRRYVFSTDHKTIGKQYLSLALAMALLGGFTAYLIRWQLAWPGTPAAAWGVVQPDFYNVLVTMHGTIMVFFVAMPILLGSFGNFL